MDRFLIRLFDSAFPECEAPLARVTFAVFQFGLRYGGWLSTFSCQRQQWKSRFDSEWEEIRENYRGTYGGLPRTLFEIE